MVVPGNSCVLLFLSRATGKRILSLIALSLDLDAEFFHKNGAFEPPSAFIRLLHYAGKFPLFFWLYIASYMQWNLIIAFQVT
jgi:hypothetical protein